MMHGGKSLVGAASPQIRHGRYSKFLPERLKERYEEAVADSDLIALREDIALLDSRIGDLLTRVDTGESGNLWRAIGAAWHDWKNAPTVIETEKAKLTLDALIEKGTTDYQAWDEVLRLVELRRKTAESERKRLVDLQQMVTSEKLMVMVTALVDVVKRHVPDPLVLSSIATDIRALVERGSEGVGGSA